MTFDDWKTTEPEAYPDPEPEPPEDEGATMTEPTDEELRDLWTRDRQAGLEERLRAMYQAGVASQAARIAELEGSINKREDYWRRYAELRKGEIDTLTRELADVRTILVDFDKPHAAGDPVGIRQVATKAAVEVLRLRTDKSALLAKVDALTDRLAELERKVDWLENEVAKMLAGDGR